MKSLSKPTIKAYSDVLTFGKYKGQTVEWILKNNPSYIIWLAHKEIADISGAIYTDASALHEHNQSRKFLIRTGRYSYESIYPDDDVWSYFDPPY